jgi:hypothetical protein
MDQVCNMLVLIITSTWILANAMCLSLCRAAAWGDELSAAGNVP